MKTIVIMPAYNAEATVEKTVLDLPPDTFQEIILCDDCSSDNTVELAKKLGLTVLEHDENRGYGANQKTCYDAALKTDADIIAMIHPDYQYDPRTLPAAIKIIELDICDMIMGSRIRTRRETLQCGMPRYKYFSNRFLTAVENIGFGQNLGDFHSGFRVYHRRVLDKIDYSKNSNDFIFDTQLLAQAFYHNFRVDSIPVPTRYSDEASSINFLRSLKYGFGCLGVLSRFLLHKAHILKYSILADKDK